MYEIEHDILPGIGLGQLMLGMREHAVRSLLGDPSETSEQGSSDGREPNHHWKYEWKNLALTFGADEDYRLVTITTSFEWAALRGSRIVGLDEKQLLKSDFGGLGPPAFDDDFEEFGRDYCWDSINLSCWVVDRSVVNVSIMCLYDETGMIPQWPTRDG